MSFTVFAIRSVNKIIFDTGCVGVLLPRDMHTPHGASSSSSEVLQRFSSSDYEWRIVAGSGVANKTILKKITNSSSLRHLEFECR